MRGEALAGFADCFQHHLLEVGAASLGGDAEVLDADAACSREQQLTEDLVEILTVFSSRLYGSRSRKNLRAVAAQSS